jgi:hypothetical protein
VDKVYVHSWHADFARTQPMPDYPGEDKAAPAQRWMCLFGCGCGKNALARIARAPLMRLMPFFRLYRCTKCGGKVFRSRIRQRLPSYGA